MKPEDRAMVNEHINGTRLTTERFLRDHLGKTGFIAYTYNPREVTPFYVIYVRLNEMIYAVRRDFIDVELVDGTSFIVTKEGLKNV